MAQSTGSRKCYTCKNIFKKTSMFEYGKIYYCHDCYNARLERDKFSKMVCSIFGLKKPGSRIWKERERLINKGFTDNEIVKCLDYVYNVMKFSKASESLYAVTNANIGAANAYFKEKEFREKMEKEENLSKVKKTAEKNFIKAQLPEEKILIFDLDDILNEEE